VVIDLRLVVLRECALPLLLRELLLGLLLGHFGGCLPVFLSEGGLLLLQFASLPGLALVAGGEVEVGRLVVLKLEVDGRGGVGGEGILSWWKCVPECGKSTATLCDWPPPPGDSDWPATRSSAPATF
jgi:hypothetical protein